MRITIFGATGGTGTQLVHQALAQGHDVTAVVRDPSRLVLPPRPDAARTIPAERQGGPAPHGALSSGAGLSSGAALAGGAGWAGDAGLVGGAAGAGGGGTVGEVPGRLVVVVADVMDPGAVEGAMAGADAVVSAIGTRGRGPTTVCADSIASVLRAARASGTRRILMVSAAGMIVDGGDGAFIRYVVKPILGRVLRASFTDMRAAEGSCGTTARSTGRSCGRRC